MIFLRVLVWLWDRVLLWPLKRLGEVSDRADAP